MNKEYLLIHFFQYFTFNTNALISLIYKILAFAILRCYFIRLLDYKILKLNFFKSYKRFAFTGDFSENLNATKARGECQAQAYAPLFLLLKNCYI